MITGAGDGPSSAVNGRPSIGATHVALKKLADVRAFWSARGVRALTRSSPWVLENARQRPR